MKNFDYFICLEKVDWSCCILSDCVETHWNAFRDVFLKIINQFAPIKEIRLKQRTELWMDHEILELIKERDILLNTFRKSKMLKIIRIFQRSEIHCKGKLRKLKTEHISVK